MILAVIDIINQTLGNLLQWIDGLGIWGVGIFILSYIITTILLIPGSLLTLGAGVIFDVIYGSIIVSIASTLGATLAFLIGRYFLRAWVNKQIATRPKFKAIDDAVGKDGGKIVLLTRLSPIFPFIFLNYAFAVTKVSLRDYVLASWMGMIPGTVMYVYLGSAIGDITNLFIGNRARSPLELVLYISGLFTTVIVTVYVTRIAKKALNNQLGE